MAEFVAVRGLRKRYGDAWAVDSVDFAIEEGKLLVLLGPSGCGKTTTLRCVGGLEQPEEGTVVIDGEEVTNAANSLFMQPEARGMGMVAQSYSIWPHMTVYENVAFPLRMKKCGNAEIAERVQESLDLVRLGNLGSRNATDLSGGQQQRVALARAIVGRPKVLLFDEPLSNLDAKLREDMRYLLKDIQREIKITAIYVTHDQSEAMALGDELLVMNAGRIEQRGSARVLYCMPETRFVANFIGVANLLEGTLLSADTGDGNFALVRLGSGEEEGGRVLRLQGNGGDIGSRVTALVRPEWAILHQEKPETGDNLIPGVVHKCQYLGDRTEVLVNTQFLQMRVWADGVTSPAEGSEVQIEIDGRRSVLLPQTNGRP